MEIIFVRKTFQWGENISCLSQKKTFQLVFLQNRLMINVLNWSNQEICTFILIFVVWDYKNCRSYFFCNVYRYYPFGRGSFLAWTKTKKWFWIIIIFHPHTKLTIHVKQLSFQIGHDTIVFLLLMFHCVNENDDDEDDEDDDPIRLSHLHSVNTMVTYSNCS